MLGAKMSDVIFIGILGTPTEKESAMISPLPVFSYFSAYLAEQGFSSETIYIARDKEYSEFSGIDLNPPIEKILSQEKPKIVAFSPLTPTYNKAVEIANIVKKTLPETITCVGNVHVTAFPQQALKDGFDYVFLNEGFISFPNFVERVMQGEKDIDQIIPEEKLYNLDSIPFANYDTLRPSALGMPIGKIFTSFSCPFRCKFCTNFNFTGAHWREMSTERVAEEIKHQNKSFGVTFFSYGDPVLLPNEESLHRIGKINQLIDEFDIDHFGSFMNCRIDLIARMEVENPQLLDQALRKASVFFVGVETTDDKILSSYRKNLSLETARRGIEALMKRDKMVLASFIIGGLSDTYETIEEIAVFIRETGITYGDVSILTPLPLTDFYKEFEERNLFTTKDWDLFDFRHLVFKHPVFKPSELDKIKEEIKSLFMLGQKERLKRGLE
jgi:radical SAM superfamily enzyme YgiQ (UPF0313 family)